MLKSCLGKTFKFLVLLVGLFIIGEVAAEDSLLVLSNPEQIPRIRLSKIETYTPAPAVHGGNPGLGAGIRWLHPTVRLPDNCTESHYLASIKVGETTYELGHASLQSCPDSPNTEITYLRVNPDFEDNLGLVSGALAYACFLETVNLEKSKIAIHAVRGEGQDGIYGSLRSFLYSEQFNSQTGFGHDRLTLFRTDWNPYSSEMVLSYEIQYWQKNSLQLNLPFEGVPTFEGGVEPPYRLQNGEPMPTEELWENTQGYRRDLKLYAFLKGKLLGASHLRPTHIGNAAFARVVELWTARPVRTEISKPEHRMALEGLLPNSFLYRAPYNLREESKVSVRIAAEATPFCLETLSERGWEIIRERQVRGVRFVDFESPAPPRP